MSKLRNLIVEGMYISKVIYTNVIYLENSNIPHRTLIKNDTVVGKLLSWDRIYWCGSGTWDNFNHFSSFPVISKICNIWWLSGVIVIMLYGEHYNVIIRIFGSNSLVLHRDNIHQFSKFTPNSRQWYVDYHLKRTHLKQYILCGEHQLTLQWRVNNTIR